MKPVGAVSFKNRESIRERNNESRENFEIEFHDEVTLDKAIMAPEETTDTKQPSKKI